MFSTISRLLMLLGGIVFHCHCIPCARAQNVDAPRGPAPSKVVIVHDSGAMRNLIPVPDTIRAMVTEAVTNVTGSADAKAAWLSLVKTQDIVGIKVFSSPGPNSGTRPAVVEAVVKGLLDAGLPSHNIIIWDARMVDLRLAGFTALAEQYGIRAMGGINSGYDESHFYETPLLGTLRYTDHEFGKTGPGVGRKSFVCNLVSRDITKIISIVPLMHHNLAGVSGNLYSVALGAVDNTLRFEGEKDSLANAVPEIYALPIIGDRVVLNIVDALICQYEGQQEGLLHYSSFLNELRFSRDPVALDVLSIEEIQKQRKLTGEPSLSKTNISMTLYSNASLLEIGVSDPHRIQVQRLP